MVKFIYCCPFCDDEVTLEGNDGRRLPCQKQECQKAFDLANRLLVGERQNGRAYLAFRKPQPATSEPVPIRSGIRVMDGEAHTEAEFEAWIDRRGLRSHASGWMARALGRVRRWGMKT